jgi:hypothetical protein
MENKCNEFKKILYDYCQKLNDKYRADFIFNLYGQSSSDMVTKYLSCLLKEENKKYEADSLLSEHKRIFEGEKNV